MKHTLKLQKDIITQNIVIKRGVDYMVKIFDIMQKGNMISCSYTPETSDLKGYIEIDVISREVKNVKYSDYEYGKKMYVAQVRSKISELLNSKKSLPKEITAVWY